MPILMIERQKRMTEVGRIRTGDQVSIGGGKTRPNKLESFRLTSKDRSVLESAAKVYGGTVKSWEPKPGMKEWELYTTAGEIPVLASPVEPSQWLEMWSAGGCQRRCDGETCQLAKGETIEEVQCLCDPDNRECKMTTRIAVMLPDLPSLGVWRLESHGYYAAVELPEMFRVLQNGAMNGRYIPATLAIEERVVVRHGKTKKFPVPVLRLRQRLGDILAIAGQEAPALNGRAQALPSGSPALPPPSVDQIEDYLAIERAPTQNEAAAATAYIKAIKMTPDQFKEMGKLASPIDPRFVVLEAARVGITDFPSICALVAPVPSPESPESPSPEPYAGPSVKEAQEVLL